MDPVEVRETRVGTGTATLIPDDAVVASPTAMRTAAGVATPSARYSEVRTRYPMVHRASQVAWLLVGILDTILALDFLFRALSANNTGFANFIYSLGGGLAAPFDGIFGNTINDAGNGTIGIDRWADLMAIVIYSLVALAIVKAVQIATTPKDDVTSSSTTVV